MQQKASTRTSSRSRDEHLGLLLETDAARDAFIARVGRELPAGECLVEVKDLEARRRSFTTRPFNGAARLVAQLPARLIRGCLLARTKYYIVPVHDLEGIERHYEAGEFTHSYMTRLRPLAYGQAGHWSAGQSVAA